MADSDNRPKRVFISYSHKDEAWKERLHTQLKVLELENLLTVWQDRQISAGDDWYPAIEEAINSSQVAILLISADLLGSNFIRSEEIPRLLKRRAQEGLRLIPLILKPCPWEAVPWLKSIQGSAKDNKPLSGLNEHEQDQCLANLAMEIHQLIQSQSEFVTPAPPNNLPFRSLGSLFKGRDKFLKDLHQQFQREPKRMQAIVPWQAIHGLGGIGKSRAAVEYAWKYLEDYAALLFLKADSPLTLITSLAGLCPMLGEAKEVTDDIQRAQAARQWLQGHRGWLLIVDNVDIEEAAVAVDEWLKHLDGGHVLITSRIKEWRPDVTAHPLDVLDLVPAAAFLLERTEGGRIAKPDDTHKAQELAEELGRLALALEQAAAFIRKHSLSFGEYLQRWRKADKKTREWHDERLMQYPRPLATTWQTSVDILNAPARALLEVLAWLAPEPIPRFLFDYANAPEGLPEAFYQDSGFPARQLAELSGVDEADPEAAFADLRGVSLLLPAQESDIPYEGKLHRVLALITRERQDEAARQKNLTAALALVDAVAVGDSTDVRYWSVWESLVQLILAVASFGEDKEMAEPTGRLLNDLALLLNTKALHNEAEQLYLRSLTLAEQHYGQEHSEFAFRLSNYVLLLQDTNRLEKAEPLMRWALAIDESNFGSQHPDVACDLNNLALLLRAMSRLEEAEPLMLRALDITEVSFGPQHPKTASCINNLAQFLKDTNRLEEAEPLMIRVIEIFERDYGEDHPEVARALNNLARLLQDTNRLDEAEPLMQRALAIVEATYGKAHPDVALYLNNLARLLQDTNRLDEAEPLMQRALLILLNFTRTTGHSHPNLQTIFYNYLSLLEAQGVDGATIGKRLLALGVDAGYEGDAYAVLLARLFNPEA